MKSWATQLLALTLVAAVHLIHANSFPTFVTEACPDATEVYKSSSYKTETRLFAKRLLVPVDKLILRPCLTGLGLLRFSIFLLLKLVAKLNVRRQRPSVNAEPLMRL